ncbi:cytochrome d ubiquinol oxidase subunit II [Acrocarpospora macrocephala]|uniref:Cytochrome c oxidase assembly protein n=1 Tax=Acrocarpospora macrocephala TaxID=150177 RepID=A0A5M3X120_9ACTN|nr:cytochrome d ubiquinol oxidase subunit II [Acrocarpospora macrocephala]GES13819.1 cytochrome c oxidase assembly protein [Acrocarpospora macrocephala]
MDLTDVWFAAIAVLWMGYFILEGFDFGVGALLPVLASGDTERRVMINTIGPVWDGNEVWLITVGAATFAAFPEWYATLFSGFYLPMLVILLTLIVRGVAFEYRAKRDSVRWRRGWDRCLIAGSIVPAVLWGVAFGNIVRGVELDARHDYVGSFWDLLNPYALLGGLTTLALFVTHGAIFLALKTEGEIREKAGALALKAGFVAGMLVAGFLVWSQFHGGSGVSIALGVVAVVVWALAVAAIAVGREGWAFTASAVAIGLVTVTLFAVLYPNVLPAVDPANSLTTTNAAATAKTLRIMTWVAVLFLPLVLIYQSWTYWVFRRRIGVRNIPAGH